MATCEMKNHIEDNNYNRFAIDFELLVTLDELNEKYELACPESLNLSSDLQNQDDIFEDFRLLYTDILLPATKKEEINDLKNGTSLCIEDTSHMQAKEGGKCLKQTDLDLSFLDAFDIEELCGKEPGTNDIEIVSPPESESSLQGKEGGKGQKQQDVDLSFLDAFDIEELYRKEPAINDIEIVSPPESVQPKVKIISQRTRKVEPSLRILLLKNLALNANCFYALS